MTLRNQLDQLKRDLERVHQGIQADTNATYAPECICFPAGEPPALSTEEEIAVARAVKCPQHGERFADVRRPVVFRSAWLVRGEWEHDFPHNSRQYAKAMRASFPADHNPPATRNGETR